MGETTGAVYYCRLPEQLLGEENRISKQLLRHGFMDFFQEDLKDGEIARYENGKPYYIKNSQFYFNISHCSGGAAAAVSHVPVGVDAECMRKVNERTVKKCCSKEEISYVFGGREAAPEQSGILSDTEAERFLKLWTLKESYVKMTGEGLRRPLNEVCFCVQEGKGFDPLARHSMYLPQPLILALTVRWEIAGLEPKITWEECKTEILLDLF